ncbi:hypothetical protein AA0N74_01675 [Chromobacterium vaccinii]|uniref:hypothetical protein n=1 Tax=Chromobacterium vaccinii TaxID=1108595 RepID=UPI0031DA2489
MKLLKASKNFIATAMLAVVASPSALAMSKPYDAVAGAIIKDGSPCFYSLVPLESPPPAYLKDMGVEISVFNQSPRNPGYIWHIWFQNWQRPLPTSSAACIAYGIKSPDKNPQPAKPLPRNTPLSFAMDGQYGRQNVRFCIRKNAQGHDFLSTVINQDGVYTCTNTPLKNKPQ